MPESFYNTQEWRALRERVIARDGSRCTVARLLGGECGEQLHVHHIEAVEERPDLALDPDNCATVCHRHHPTWESLRRWLTRRHRPLPPCRHRHPYIQGRIECDRRRARALGIELPEPQYAAA